MKQTIEVVHSGVVVIGAGVAGLSAALEAALRTDVALLHRGKAEQSNTHQAQGGVAAAVEPGDCPEEHLADTLVAGAGACDEKAVDVLVREGPQRVRRLADLGCPFDRRPDGSFRVGREGAHNRPRVIPAGGDSTGRAVARTLLGQLTVNKKISVFGGMRALELLVDKGRCVGLVACDQSGQLKAFLARAVVLASGGCGRLFEYTTGGPFCDGQSLAMAARGGADLADMEFVQFHPTALDAPGMDPLPLVSEAVRGHGAILIDQRGRRFMPAIHPMAELAPRDVVARAIYARLISGDRVFLDATAFGPEFAGRFPQVHGLCREHGIDPATEPIPVTPAAHFTMGGLVSDLEGCTSLPGLFVCGEAARTGVHGANRLASNSLLEGLVFGPRAGKTATTRPAPMRKNFDKTLDMDRLAAMLPVGVEPASLFPASGEADSRTIADLRRVMWRHVGLMRNEMGLGLAAWAIQEMAEQANAGQITLSNMLQTAGFIVQAALIRRHSLGAHYRDDADDASPAVEAR